MVVTRSLVDVATMSAGLCDSRKVQKGVIVGRV